MQRLYSFCYNARVIRAYVPWYLVRNYMTFALVACLGALQLAAAHSGAVKHQRTRYAVAIAVLIGAFLGLYALAPELLTPGPAGGELTLLFGAVALLAVAITHIASRLTRNKSPAGHSGGCLAGPQLSSTAPRTGTQSDKPSHSRFVVWYLIFGLSFVVIFFDVPLFHILNSLALRTPLIDVPVQFLMNDYIAPTALVLALLALWFAGRDAEERVAFQSAVLRALLALVLASIALKLINQVYFRPRPFTFDDSVRLLFYHPSDSSMPSNAATVCFVLAVSVWLRQRRWGMAMLAVSIGMTLARVVGGVHYPADVVVGAWLGGLAAWLVNRTLWLDRPLSVICDQLSVISGR